MSRVSITRTIPHDPEEFIDLVMDFQRYPSFVPGVVRIKLKPPKAGAPTGPNAPVEVEAFLKNSKFSGTVRVLIEPDREARTIRVKPRYGPFKILSANMNLTRLAPKSTEVRFNAELSSSLFALNSIINEHLRAATVAYAEVFLGELARRSKV